MKCFKCGGIIPDVLYGSLNTLDRNDCKNHSKEMKSMTKEEVKTYLEEYSKFRSE